MDRLRISNRVFHSQRVNALTEAIRRARRSHAPAELCDLTVSNPTEVGFPFEVFAYPAREHVSGEGMSDIHKGMQAPYVPEAQGMLHAREAIAETYSDVLGAGISPDNIVLSASTSESYSYLFKLFCDAGDDVVVAEPTYPLIEHLCRLEGIDVRHYRLFYEGGVDGTWSMDVSSLRSAVTKNTKLIVIVSPNNPTGAFLKHDEISVLNQLGIPLVVDEVFAPFPLETTRDSLQTVSHAALDIPVFTVNGLSKMSALPQLKVGWITLMDNHAKRRERMLSQLLFIADMYLSVNTITQADLHHWLALGKARRMVVQARLKENLHRLDRLLTTHRLVSRCRVEGGWSVMLRLPATQSDEAWALRVLREHLTIVQPGYFFDVHNMTAFVLSLITPPDLFVRGCENILDSVRDVYS